jgi:hypothetical protein
LKIFDVKNQIPYKGEVVLGSEQTGSHACYLIYGTMKPREKGRLLKAGKGHEELFLAIQGSFVVTSHLTSDEPGLTKHVNEGQAFHLLGENAYSLENVTDSMAVYVMAGGHSSRSGHGHHYDFAE